MILIKYFSLFNLWLLSVIKKGVWILGFLPTALDYLIVYLPKDLFPAMLVDFLSQGISPQLSIIFMLSGFAISAFLVYADIQSRLWVYEKDSPHYKIDLVKATSHKSSLGGFIYLNCLFRFTSTTPWSASLRQIAVQQERGPRILASWAIVQVSPKTLPFTIPHPEFDLAITIRTELMVEDRLGFKFQWRKVPISVYFHISYPIRPIGEAQRLIRYDLKINLRAQFEEIMKIRKNQKRKEREERQKNKKRS